MPKGHKTPKVMEKEAAREALRQIVLANMEKLVAAQLHNATGLNHLMLRDPKTGKFERIHDVEAIDEALKTDTAVWIYTKDPSIQAFTDLMNRAIDKPKEQEQTIEHKGKLIVQWRTSE